MLYNKQQILLILKKYLKEFNDNLYLSLKIKIIKYNLYEELVTYLYDNLKNELNKLLESQIKNIDSEEIKTRINKLVKIYIKKIQN